MTQLWKKKKALKKAVWFKSYGHDRALGRLLWHMPNMYPPLYKEVVNALVTLELKNSQNSNFAD